MACCGWAWFLQRTRAPLGWKERRAFALVIFAFSAGFLGFAAKGLAAFHGQRPVWVYSHEEVLDAAFPPFSVTGCPVIQLTGDKRDVSVEQPVSWSVGRNYLNQTAAGWSGAHQTRYFDSINSCFPDLSTATVIDLLVTALDDSLSMVADYTTAALKTPLCGIYPYTFKQGSRLTALCVSNCNGTDSSREYASIPSTWTKANLKSHLDASTYLVFEQPPSAAGVVVPTKLGIYNTSCYEVPIAEFLFEQTAWVDVAFIPSLQADLGAVVVKELDVAFGTASQTPSLEKVILLPGFNFLTQVELRGDSWRHLDGTEEWRFRATAQAGFGTVSLSEPCFSMEFNGQTFSRGRRATAGC